VRLVEAARYAGRAAVRIAVEGSPASHGRKAPGWLRSAGKSASGAAARQERSQAGGKRGRASRRGQIVEPLSAAPKVWTRESAVTEKRNVWTALKRGFRGRCPRCGERQLFRAFLKVTITVRFAIWTSPAPRRRSSGLVSSHPSSSAISWCDILWSRDRFFAVGAAAAR